MQTNKNLTPHFINNKRIIYNPSTCERLWLPGHMEARQNNACTHALLPMLLPCCCPSCCPCCCLCCSPTLMIRGDGCDSQGQWTLPTPRGPTHSSQPQPKSDPHGPIRASLGRPQSEPNADSKAPGPYRTRIPPRRPASRASLVPIY